MGERKQTILVVDDEVKILDVVLSFLEAEGYKAVAAKNGALALKLFATLNPDLVILDIMLPDIDGVEICKAIRRKSQAPIIMLTARVGEEDTVKLLDLGADDYVTKPFSPRALVGRVRAVMRRFSGDHQMMAEILSFDGSELEINSASHEAVVRGRKVNLTPVEFKILQALAKNSKKVFTREELINVVYGFDYEGNDRSIDTHVKNLRQKVEADPRNPNFVLTVHGVGYRFGGEK